MSNSVIKVNASTIDEMKNYYATNVIAKLPPGSVFVAKVDNLTITAYKSGKVLFQGSGAEEESNKWSRNTTNIADSKEKRSSIKNMHDFAPPVNIAALSIIGSDEVGTGDYFGPITVVSAFASKVHLAQLKQLGVKDSKNLNDRQISEIAKTIINVIPYSLLVLHNEKYNELQASGYSQGKMKALLHNQAIANLIKKTANESCDGILIDQFAEPGVYFNYLKGQANVVRDRVYFSTKAEGVHLSVAAASIIARYAFIKEFEKLSAKAGVELPKGAGAKVDEVAAGLIRSKGETVLKHIAKLHFANTEKARKIAARKA